MNKYWELATKGILTDVVIVERSLNGDEKSFSVHKIVLFPASKYFEKCFTFTENSINNEKILIETEYTSCCILQPILESIYMDTDTDFIGQKPRYYYTPQDLDKLLAQMLLCAYLQLENYVESIKKTLINCFVSLDSEKMDSPFDYVVNWCLERYSHGLYISSDILDIIRGIINKVLVPKRNRYHNFNENNEKKGDIIEVDRSFFFILFNENRKFIDEIIRPIYRECGLTWEYNSQFNNVKNTPDEDEDEFLTE